MKIRMSIIAAGAAVALGTTGVLVLPAVASAHSSTHTLTFISVERAAIGFTSATQGEQDTDLNAKGKTVGYDMLYLTIGINNREKANVTVDTKGGFLYGTFKINIGTGAVTDGNVTGGTGAFVGATGTIKVKAVSGTSPKHAFTITYSG